MGGGERKELDRGCVWDGRGVRRVDIRESV